MLPNLHKEAFFCYTTDTLFGTLSAYIREIFPSVVKINLELLLRDDIDHTISRLDNFTEIRIGAYTSGINKFKEWDPNIFDAIKNTYKNAEQSQWVEIVMHVDSRTGELKAPFMKKASSFLKRHGDLVKKFKVKGIEKESGLTSSAINLLKDKLLQRKKVSKAEDNTKSVNSIEMFQKIEEAYNEVYDEIRDLI